MKLMKLIAALVTLISLSPGATAATHTVQIIYNEFLPNRLVIKVGDEVQWVHKSSFNHGVSTFNVNQRKIVAIVPEGAERFESDFMGRDDVYKHTFKTPGRYKYFCPIHGDAMVGYIDVVE